MKYLKKYESEYDYISRSIDVICSDYNIYDYTIDSNGFINVHDDVYMKHKRLSIFNYISEMPLKFGKIDGRFSCESNKLTSLIGCPKTVTDSFSCAENKLTSLIGCPKVIGGNFDCRWNEIETFEGLDFVYIGGYFYCYGNPFFKIWNLFSDHTKFEFFNDCDIIREGRVIILDRLNFFLDYIGKEIVTEVKGYKCI
jgi:hypothetical protein